MLDDETSIRFQFRQVSEQMRNGGDRVQAYSYGPARPPVVPFSHACPILMNGAKLLGRRDGVASYVDRPFPDDARPLSTPNAQFHWLQCCSPVLF